MQGEHKLSDSFRTLFWLLCGERAGVGWAGEKAGQVSGVFSNHPIRDTSDFLPWIQREKWRMEGLQDGTSSLGAGLGG